MCACHVAKSIFNVPKGIARLRANEYLRVEDNFEKKFFSENTNTIFCETFLKHAMQDPYTGEIGKTLVFCVSQSHAAKVTQILNILVSYI